MPFVFKFSIFLLILAGVSGQYWQLKAAAPDAAVAARELRAECPAMGGPKKVRTYGDQVRIYDAYLVRVIGGQVGFNGGCAAK
jgi:hypothetical protein